MSVIVARALPDVRGRPEAGAPPFLYTMHERGNYPCIRNRKSADTVRCDCCPTTPPATGLHDAMVRLAQDFAAVPAEVDGQGNFGSVDGDPTLYRYTEAHMSKMPVEMLTDIEKDTINWTPTDETKRVAFAQPLPQPAGGTGSQGIAVGMATNSRPTT